MASSQSSGGPSGAPDAVAYRFERITDGQADIATTSAGAQMKVELVDRQPLQKVWLWREKHWPEGKKRRASDSIANKPYEPDLDCPSHTNMPSALPTAEELQPHEDAAAFIEVGLALGDKPERAHEDTWKQRKIAGRNPFALRVFIAVTSKIARHVQYYVGCHLDSGRCAPCTIGGNEVFFYDELWCGPPAREHRNRFVNAAARYYAAIDNQPLVDPFTVAGLSTGAEAVATYTTPAVLQAEFSTSLLVLQFALLQETADGEDHRALLRVLHDVVAPDVSNGPDRISDAIQAFFDFGQAISREHATSLLRELGVVTVADSVRDLDFHLVQRFHQVLREENLGHQLQPQSLAPFLEMCHERVSKGATEEVVEPALQAVRIFGRTRTPSSSLQHAGPVPGFGPVADQHYGQLISDLLGVLEPLRVYIHDSKPILAQQHGGTLSHGVIKHLMENFIGATDTTSRQSLWCKLAVLYVVQHASSADQVIEKLGDLQSRLQQLRMAAVRPQDGQTEERKRIV